MEGRVMCVAANKLLPRLALGFPYNRVLIGALLLLFAGTSAGGAAGDEELASVLNAFRAQLTTLKEAPMEYEATYRTFFPEGGTISDPPDSATRKPGETVNSCQIKHKRHGRFYFHKTTEKYWWDPDKPVETWTAFDGKDERRFTKEFNGWTGGMIGNPPEGVVPVLESIPSVGTFAQGVLAGYSLAKALQDPDAQVRIDGKTVQLGEHECYVISISDKTAESTVWIDPGAGFNLRQWEIQFKDKTRFGVVDIGPWKVTDVNPEFVDGVWFPVTAKLHHRPTPDQGSPVWPAWTGEFVASNVRLNQEYTAEEFAFPFPEGTRFRDARTDLRLKMLENGVVVPDIPVDTLNTIGNDLLLSAEKQVAEAVDTYRERSTAPAPPDRQTPGAGNRFTMYYVALGAVAATLIGVAVWWRFRRASS